MDAGLVKLLVLFGIVLGLAVWELYRVSRSLDRAPPAAEARDDRPGVRPARTPTAANDRDR